MSVFKVTGAFVRGIAGLQPQFEPQSVKEVWMCSAQVGAQKCCCSENKTHCRDQEEMTSSTLFSNFLLAYGYRFA